MVELYATHAMEGWLITCGSLCLLLLFAYKKFTE